MPAVSGAIASTSRASRSVRDAPNTPARGDPVVSEEVDVIACPRGQRRQQQGGIHRPVQPGPAARVAGRRVHADPSGRRPPGVEHDDTRRSRSGRHVLTTTSDRRAVARQSIERTSSPTTYSRSESNSVPCPRVNVGDMPSISRRLASRDGRCLRDRNGGSTRTRPGTGRDVCLPANPSGPIDRAVTDADR